MNKFLFKHIDNSGLIIFRIVFGLLCFLEAFGAVLTGWIRRTLIEPDFTFSFIGFEWLQPLPGNWMYVYYIVMAIFGLLIMVGYKYRFSMLMFALMWTATYLMQKSSYNNHYYLLGLLSFIMVLLPAHRYASIDAKLNPSLKKISMPSWCKWVFVIQLFILYSYASIAKLYPDWLDASVVKLLMRNKADYPIIGELLQQSTIHYFIAYGGILFDGLIIPLLLIKPTRKYAFFISIFFHLFNSIVFQIGIFPYLALAFSLFFFEPKVIRNIFLKQKPYYNDEAIIIPSHKPILISLFSIYFLIQVALPLRHHFFKDDVLWTEEGHRLSWRMMLRAKNGSTRYKVIDEATNKQIPIKINDYLTKKQRRGASTKPDAIWQFAQHLKQDFAKKGISVRVYVSAFVSVNGKPAKQLINPNVDIANEEWYHFKHHDWILPSK
ncbi:HTTM domain-containing protein [Winogradskyella echinorum]|uniref:HTTM domain-containing protein n=1 Tax=Winogradskyella echinorum TaxID=538189 RepID=A0ABR6XZU4_9FLAO|nr:HTTM domain-containing protein [Winogradskyella echinorum]MBC3846002.1 HTTM domain-containing protein [Winogradskyella echinorum]MBC5750350.1 HTTM domain-containing protein [Winogradskyella echinorum]